jgi:hypothetical protein
MRMMSPEQYSSEQKIHNNFSSRNNMASCSGFFKPIILKDIVSCDMKQAKNAVRIVLDSEAQHASHLAKASIFMTTRSPSPFLVIYTGSPDCLHSSEISL